MRAHRSLLPPAAARDFNGVAPIVLLVLLDGVARELSMHLLPMVFWERLDGKIYYEA